MAVAVATLSEQRTAYLDGLVSRAKAAAAAFASYTQEDVDSVVKPMVLAGMEQAQHLARLAVEETRLGVLEDKAIKNMVATEFVYDYVRDKRTVGGQLAQSGFMNRRKSERYDRPQLRLAQTRPLA